MRRLWLAFIMLPCMLHIQAQGVPFIKNFLSAEYGGHNQNFDMIADDKGHVFVANFEGLLYYDNASWNMIHTPGVTRIVTLYRDAKGVIWTGGYNYIGHLRYLPNGSLALYTIPSQGMLHGEVQQFWEHKGMLYFKDSQNNVFTSDGIRMAPAPEQQEVRKDIITSADMLYVNQALSLDDGITALATNGQGVILLDQQKRELFRLTEDNGLCSNNVNRIAHNGRGQFWGATDNGIFVVDFPSIYTHFTTHEGLRGEALSIEMLQGQIYVGTLNGLFRLEGKVFTPVKGVAHACWQLAKSGSSLLAATANGVYRIHQDGQATQLTTSNTLSIMATAQGFYSGEMDGVYLTENGKRTAVSRIEKVVQMTTDRQGDFWLRNLYGKIWKGKTVDGVMRFVAHQSNQEAATLVNLDHQLVTISASTTDPISYPTFSYQDPSGVTWLTNNKGKELYAFSQGKVNSKESEYVAPLANYSFRTMFVDGTVLWMGGDKGVNVIDRSHVDPTYRYVPHLYIRSVKLNGDSILWGGYGVQPEKLPTLSSDNRHLTIEYATDCHPLQQPMLYRHRLDNHQWSAWEKETAEEYPSMEYGTHRFEVQARDVFGRTTNIASMSISIGFPFYLKWYMIVLYIVLLGILLIELMKFRLRRLEREKIRLENVVQLRTAEVVKQKDEIEEKSKSLETALKDLGEAQHELVRQEKMATVGKLTQGLIDRILNPLNYINNFAKLSEGLVKDVVANVEDEKDHMDPENYEDTIDVLDMLKGNLQKVGEHGANTTRTLKAMEEMLKDRTGGISPMNLTALLKQDEEMVNKYFEKDITDYHIQVRFNYPAEDMMMNGNADQLSKTLMSLLGNAVYAVVKKAQRQSYSPEVTLSASQDERQIIIKICDNGVGIEQTIIDKIFDPFFTTKTTGEASGVGLYLSREIAQNHGGDIQVKSQKDTLTEFTITLPKNQSS